MKIALATTEFITEAHCFDGGLSNYLYRVAISLLDLGHQPVVFVYSDRNELLYKDAVPVYRVCAPQLMRRFFDPVKWMNRFNRLTHFWFAYLFDQLLLKSYALYTQIIQIHRQNPFDIIQYPHLGGLGIFRLQDVPSVIRLSSFTKLWRKYGAYSMMPNRDIAFQSFLENLALKRADAIFGPCDKINQFCEQELYRHVETIESPFLFESIQYDYQLYNRILHKKKYLLFFGTLQKHKGIEVIAEILWPVFNKYPTLHFVFVGKQVPLDHGTLPLDLLRENAQKYHKNIIYFDRLPHSSLYPIIEEAHAVVLPSLIDNFPNTCLEAMAHKKVVIGTTGNGFDQLISDTMNGYLIEPENAEMLLQTIHTIMNLSKQQIQEIGEKAYQRINDLQPEKVVKKLVQFYQHVIVTKLRPNDLNREVT